jgi:hypothetical protein
MIAEMPQMLAIFSPLDLVAMCTGISDRTVRRVTEQFIELFEDPRSGGSERTE